MIEAVKAIKNDENEYNLKILKDGKWFYLYNPTIIRKSVRNEIENIVIQEDIEIIIIIGVGLGYHTVDLINTQKLFNKKVSIISIEPIDIIAKVANKIFNLKKSLEPLPNMHYVYGNKIAIQQQLTTLLSKLHVKLKKTKFIIPDNYSRLFPNETKYVFDIIKYRILSNAIKVGNSIDDTILGIYNMFRNTQSILDSLPLGILVNYYKNYPVVIVSAGPSLNKNIDVLRKYQDRVLIIATDATFKILLSKNIRVDFVTVLERDYVTYKKFFEGVEYNNIPTLIYQSVAWPDIAATFKNTKIVTFKAGLPTEEKCGEFLGEKYVAIPSGTSVATMSISIAKILGAKKIILIGQDLAYSEEGYTHAYGVSVRKKIDLKNSIELDGIDGRKVKSTFIWKNFKLEIEDLIKINNLNVIDATEGGALIEGTKVMTLDNALRNLPKINITYNFKTYDINKKNLFSNMRRFKDFFIKQINETIFLLQEQKNIDVKNEWNDFLLNYSKIEKYFYFPHFHSSNSSLLMFYYNSKHYDKIYSLLDNMIITSQLLIDFINVGFQVGEKYSVFLSKINHKYNSDMKFDDFIALLEFMIKYRFPFEALDLLNKMVKLYDGDKNKMIKIYRYYILFHSNFIIEKASNTHKAIYFFLKLIRISPDSLNDQKLLNLVNRNIDIVFNEFKLMCNSKKFSLTTLNKYFNSILEVLLIINNIERQCELLHFFSPQFESLEALIAKYNCLIYNNEISEAKTLLERISKKFPNNRYVIQELLKYNKHNIN